MAVVADIVGHGSPAMTEHYFHANMETKAKAVEAIALPMSDAGGQSGRERLLAWARSANGGEIDRAVKVLEDAGIL